MIPKVTENTFIDGLDEDTVAWKKAYIRRGDDSFPMEVIVELIIPKDAKLVLGFHKCRASYVKVAGIYPASYNVDYPDPMSAFKFINVAAAWYTYPFFTCQYLVGRFTYPDRFDPDPSVTCSHGIHFFRTYREAVEYSFI